MNPLTRWRLRRLLREGEEARALRLAGEGSLDLLSRLGMHLTVCERADTARSRSDRIAVAISAASLGRPVDLDALPRLDTGRSRRLAAALASRNPREALRLLPGEAAEARAACLIELGDFDAAAESLRRAPAGGTARQVIERHALASALAARQGALRAARQALDAMFTCCGLDAAVEAADAPLGLDALRVGTPCREGPLVSVIMPAHNAAATLRTAASSVLGQTWASLELLVVDDASEDETATIAESLGDQRLRVLRQSGRGGAYAARNRGLREARGAFIAFNDADDWSHPQRLARAVEQLEAGAPAVLSRLVRLDEEGVVRAPRVFPLVRLNPASLVLPRALAARLGPYEEVQAGADMEFIGRIVLACGAASIRHDRVPLTVASMRRGSLTWGSETGIDRREGIEARTRYFEAWMRRHAVQAGAVPSRPSSRPTT